MQKLYIVKAHFFGKDLDHEAIAGYLIAENDEEVYNKLNTVLDFDEDVDEDNWASYYGIDKQEIIEKKGDVEQEYMGEFYDIKYRWEEVDAISDKEKAVFEKFKMLKVGVDWC